MLRISVVGLGLMGRQHLTAVEKHRGCELASIIDKREDVLREKRGKGYSCFSDLGEAIKRTKPDGIIIATPNFDHVPTGLEALDYELPMLIEKPVSDDLNNAVKLIENAERKNVPILIGYHRRHNRINQKIKLKLEKGIIGKPVAAHGMFWIYKPEDYFNQLWRTRAGAGPIFINLSHDIDLLRYFLGEIDIVQTIASNKIRGFPVEDSAVIIFKFSSGVVGSFSLSDTIVSPWSYELTYNENPAYYPTDQSCYWIGGTEGSVELPKGNIWSNRNHRSWWEPIKSKNIKRYTSDPVLRQLDNFLKVISEEEMPLVPGIEGLKTSAVIEAISLSSKTQEPQKPQF
ncbi:MAG: Gfo/Idh/MocA family oxidoreductase [Pseudomonadota bacterium]|nr:Gfo/Idh/MocA family oxidoreductase [Pseudomonadota bacterium]